MDFRESLEFLFGLQRFGIKLGLDITRTLLEMLSDGDGLREMGRAARQDAEKRFGARRMALETAGVYEAVSPSRAA